MTDDEMRKLIHDEIEAALSKHVRAYHRKGGRDKPETVYEWNFEKARVAYPGKKRGFRTEFDNFCAHHADWQDLLDDDGLAQCVQTLIQKRAYSPGFWPMFQTFCNQKRYEEAL